MADLRIPPLLRAALQLRAENDLTAYFLHMADPENVKPLSSSAQTIFDAAWNLPISLGDTETTRRRQIAASLHSVTDQLKLGTEDWEGSAPDEYERGWNGAMGRIAQIAAELDGDNG
jgi:hypothetical protein